MKLTHALDVSKWSGLISEAEWQAAKSRGFTLAIVGAWHGTEANEYAQETILNAYNAGMQVAAYTVLNAEDGHKSVLSALEACGDQTDNLLFMALDVEVVGLTEKVFDEAHIELLTSDVVACVYTRSSFWKGTLGNPNWGIGLPLWDANYDGVDQLILTNNYGGWNQTSIVGKQYTGSNTRLGFDADCSVFNAEWVGE